MPRKIAIFIGTFIGALLFGGVIVYAVTITPYQQGGTGFGYPVQPTPGAIIFENTNTKLATSSGLKYATSTNTLNVTNVNVSGTCTGCGGGGGGGGDPFTHPSATQSATTTEVDFTGGIISTASSTFSATTSFSGVTVKPVTNTSASVSVGGAFNLTNTLNDGAGMILFTNHAGSALGRLFSVDCGNAAFDQNCVNIQSNGTQSVLNISGGSPGLGIVKIAGLAGAQSNNNSALLSGDTSVNSFQGQGIFVKCNGGTTTPCEALRDNNSNLMFSVDGNKVTTMILSSTTNATITGATWLTNLTGPAELGIDSTGKVYAAASTTAGTGLSYSGGAFNVNSSQSIATLSNLSTNGFVQTSGSNGTLGVQTFPCTIAQGCNATTTLANAYNSTTIAPLLFYSQALGTVSDTAANTGLFWDETNKRLAVGTTTPQVTFDVAGSANTAYTPSAFSGLRAVMMNTNTTNNNFAEWTMNTNSTAGAYSTGVRQMAIFTNHNPVSADYALVNNNAGTLQETMRVKSTGQVGIATTTPFWALTVASSTGPQIAMVDGSPSSNAWTMRNISGNLYFATSSNSSSATSSTPAISVITAGGYSTTTVYNNFEIGQNFRDDQITSALILDGSTGIAGAYGGTSCTNQFVRSINGAGAASCNSVADTDFTGQLSLAHGGTGKDLSAAAGVVTVNGGVASTYATSSTGFYANGGSNGNVLGITNGVVGWVATTSGAAGSSVWPFTTTDTNFGVSVQSTTTPEWFKGTPNSLMASGTAQFVYASTTQLSASGSLCINGGCRTVWPSSGAGVWPFTKGLSTFGVNVQSTTTAEWFQNGLYSSSTVAFSSSGGSSMYWDATNGRLGIGTFSPAERLHLACATGTFCTFRNDSGATQSYWFSYDGDNSVNIGSNSNSQFNFKVNNATEAYIPTGQNGFTVQSSTGNHSWLNVTAPATAQSEATLTTKLDHGSGNTEFVDWTTENYGTDWQHSINVAKAGTGTILPFSLRFWNSDLGNIAANGYYGQTWLPDGSTGIGVSTSTKGTNGANTLLYAASSTATNLLKMDAAAGTTRFVFTGSGNEGIGSSTPWGLLSIAAPAITNYTTPLVAVATSSDPFGWLMGVWATSTTMVAGSLPKTWELDDGVRFTIGTTQTYDYPGLLDQMTVNGRINTLDWRFAECRGHTAAGIISADQSSACGDFGYQIDTAGEDIAQGGIGSGGLMFDRICTTSTSAGSDCTGAALAGRGSGFFFPNETNGSFIPATSTPVFEAVARLVRPEAATSSSFYIGFENIDATGVAFETEPTQGCYFNASSTADVGDWYAVCRTSSALSTYVDTGFASSTVLVGTGTFIRFRIEEDNNSARFYMGSNTASMRIVANISTTYPNTKATLAGVYLANVGGMTVTPEMDVGEIKVWFRNPFTNY